MSKGRVAGLVGFTESSRIPAAEPLSHGPWPLGQISGGGQPKVQ